MPLSRDQALVLFLLGETQSVVYIRLHFSLTIDRIEERVKKPIQRAVFAYFATNGTATKNFVIMNREISSAENSVDSDQLASEEAS